MLVTDYPAEYIVGVDLGQRQDYTGIAVLEEQLWVPEAARFDVIAPASGWLSPEQLVPAMIQQARSWVYQHGLRPDKPPMALRHVERLPLGTRYPDVVQHVARLLAASPLVERRVALVIDETGVGTAVLEMFTDAGLACIPITITGGMHATPSRGGYHVPKRELVASLQVLLQTGRLQIAEELEWRKTLVEEFQNFKVTINEKTAHDSYGAWREGAHDDLVLSVALAAWWRDFQAIYWDEASGQKPVALHDERRRR